MKSFNRVTLMGHLAADVELRQTKSGVSVANFPIATNRMIKDEKGEKTEAVDFHRVIVWQGLADVCAKYLTKGMPVMVEGRLINRSFDDKEGNKHFRTEVIASNVNFLTWRKNKGKEEIGVESVSEEPEVEIEEIEAEAAVAA